MLRPHSPDETRPPDALDRRHMPIVLDPRSRFSPEVFWGSFVFSDKRCERKRRWLRLGQRCAAKFGVSIPKGGIAGIIRQANAFADAFRAASRMIIKVRLSLGFNGVDMLRQRDQRPFLPAFFRLSSWLRRCHGVFIHVAMIVRSGNFQIHTILKFDVLDYFRPKPANEIADTHQLWNKSHLDIVGDLSLRAVKPIGQCRGTHKVRRVWSLLFSFAHRQCPIASFLNRRRRGGGTAPPDYGCLRGG